MVVDDGGSRRPPRPSSYWDPGSESDPESGSESDDDDPAGFKRRARRRSKSAKAVIKRCVSERQEKALKKSSSSGLFKAMKPTDKWLKRLRRSLLADEGGLSFFAVMCGCWWPCGGSLGYGGLLGGGTRARLHGAVAPRDPEYLD